MVSVTLHAAQSVKASTVMASVSCFVLIVRAPSAMVSVSHASIASTPSLSECEYKPCPKPPSPCPKWCNCPKCYVPYQQPS
ncbi:hypothetical protein JHK86_018086 [Glycine max]|nr:hypothetical protein JHK86_018086 [Glycine max]